MVDILRKIGSWFNASADKLATVDDTLNDKKKYIFAIGFVAGVIVSQVLK